MVDVLSFDAREAKDTKIDSLYKTLRLFDLSYSDFARLEWLGVPRNEVHPHQRQRQKPAYAERERRRDLRGRMRA